MNTAPKDPSFAEAVTELMRLSGWSKAEVLADPHSAYWAASGRLARCKNVVAAGERR